MGMAEIRDAFEAYAAGEMAEFDLRSALRAEIQQQPGEVSRYAAMVAALRRRRLISAELEAAVLADMQSEPTSASPMTPAHAVDISRPSLPVSPQGHGWDTQDRLAEAVAALAVGAVLRERFELVEELGRGGMGVVYKALDQREIESKGREPYVAIKVLNEEFKRHPESARALQRESKKSMRLAHPNIVLVRDFDRDRGNVFMVMELLHGVPLDQLVSNQYPQGIPLPRAIDIVKGLGAGLSHAHQQSIVHADFKPSNAFLTSRDTVKVLDFGVARVALAHDRGHSTLFDAGKLNAVSPAYASIELLVGEAPDPRDDIYALACVTYYLLTGRHPFGGVDAIKARVSRLSPTPISGLADHRWKALCAAMVFERRDRTPSVIEFVTQFCSDQPQRGAKVFSASKPAKIPKASSRIDRPPMRPSPNLSARAARLADVASRRPWLTAAPAGVALAVGVAVLLVLRSPTHAGAPTNVAAPASGPTGGRSAAGAPAADSARIAQLELRLTPIDAAAPDFFEKAVAASEDIKKLKMVAPSDEVLRKLQLNLQYALSVQTQHLLAGNDVNGARRLASRVAALLPPGSTRSYSPESLLRRQEIVHLMAAPESTSRWADQIGSAIHALAAVAPADDPLVRQAREMSDNLFAVAADDARSHQRMDQAREYLSIGLSVDERSPALQRAALDLAKQ